MSETKEAFEIDETKTKVPFIRVRFIQIALLFFLLLLSFSIRTCLSVAIVAMTTNNTSSNPDIPIYHWNNTNIILSSFFWSYAILQFFAGQMAQRFGTKWFLFSSMLMNALTSILVPISAEYLGANGVMACRIIQGLFQGFLLPLANNMLGRWSPVEENSVLNITIYIGVNIGVIVSMLTTGYFSASPLGWPAAFYFFGGLGLVWCIFWLLFSAESPAKHKTITVQEREYIENSLGQQHDHLEDAKKVPWKAIFKSLPYWAIIVASIGESWGTTLLNSELPTYLSRAVGLNIQESSLYSAAPTVAAILCGLCYGPIADFLINRKYLSRANSRRLFHGVGSLTASAGLISISFIENKEVVVGVLIVTVCSSFSVTCGHLVNHIDISPRFAGILAGISNGTGQLVAILAPVLVHFIVTDEEDKTSWRTTFIMAGIITISTAMFFIIFLSGERQWWDNVEKPTRTANKETKDFGEINQCFENEIKNK